MGVTAVVTAKGPLFDGRAGAVMGRGTAEARHTVAAEGQRLVHAAFSGQIKNPTGTFDRSITSTDETRTYTTRGARKSYSMMVTASRATDTVVTTSLATYGPWLEGTGSRNETTRFKGYHGFRRASQQLDAVAAALADRALAPYIAEVSL